jgi:ethanolamine utilization cobalamin adenosyltransferase
MIADFFTKPLQGKLFRTLRDVVMGVEHISTLDSIEIEDDTELSPSNEERVGKRISRVSFADNNSNEANVEVSKTEGDVGNEKAKNKNNETKNDHSFVLTQSVV